MGNLTKQILNEVSNYYDAIINENIDELTAWHNTNAKFDAFDTNFIGSGCGSQAYGWGIYVATDRDVADGYKSHFERNKRYIEGTTKEGSYEYTVEIPDDDGHNYIEWDGYADDRIKELLGNQGNNSIFCDIYQKCGLSPKEASLKLLNAGYDGIKVEGGRNNGGGLLYNYVVFDASKVKITDRKDYEQEIIFEYGGKLHLISMNDSSGNERYNFLKRDKTLVLDKPVDQWFDYVYHTKDDMMLVGLDEKFTYVNMDGSFLTSKWYDYCDYFKEGHAVVKIGDKYNLIDMEGNEISRKWFDMCSQFKNGVAIVKRNGKCNYIKQNGMLLSYIWFDTASEFNEGFARVSINKQSNYLKMDGKLLCKNWFDTCFPFKNGRAIVKQGMKYYMVDFNGDIDGEINM